MLPLSPPILSPFSTNNPSFSGRNTPRSPTPNYDRVINFSLYVNKVEIDKILQKFVGRKLHPCIIHVALTISRLQSLQRAVEVGNDVGMGTATCSSALSSSTSTVVVGEDVRATVKQFREGHLLLNQFDNVSATNLLSLQLNV